MRCFYRPHQRVVFDNSVVDPNTGEVSYPPSMTKQEFVKECDINNILKQYSQTGMLNHVNQKAAQGMYTDLPDYVDFQLSLDLVANAKTSFESLPSKVRDHFGNDPGAFLFFMESNPSLQTLSDLGLTKTPLPSPQSDQTTNVSPPLPPEGEGGGGG